MLVTPRKSLDESRLLSSFFKTDYFCSFFFFKATAVATRARAPNVVDAAMTLPPQPYLEGFSSEVPGFSDVPGFSVEGLSVFPLPS